MTRRNKNKKPSGKPHQQSGDGVRGETHGRHRGGERPAALYGSVGPSVGPYVGRDRSTGRKEPDGVVAVFFVTVADTIFRYAIFLPDGVTATSVTRRDQRFKSLPDADVAPKPGSVITPAAVIKQFARDASRPRGSK